MTLPADVVIDAQEVWMQVFRGAAFPGMRPALFLDRDGVIIEDRHYIHKIEDVFFIEGAAQVIAAANRAGVWVVMVTNQAGIARGYYGWEEFAAVQAHVLARLAGEGARVDAVFACPHHPKGLPPYDHPDPECRKPNPGLLLRATRLLPVDMRASWIIGDRASDIAAGRNAGLAGGIQVLTGHGAEEGEREKSLALATPAFAVLAASSIAEAGALVPFLGRQGPPGLYC